MRMGTKGRLAVNALLDLALRENAGPVALLSISERQQVSLSYLEQLFSGLRRQGIVESTRGPGGGYTLGRPADQITVAQIVSAVDADEAEPRTGRSDPVTAQLWQQLEAVALAHLATVRLQQLVEQQLAAGISVEARAARRSPPLPQASNDARLPLRCTAPNSVFAFGRSFAA